MALTFKMEPVKIEQELEEDSTSERRHSQALVHQTTSSKANQFQPSHVSLSAIGQLLGLPKDFQLKSGFKIHEGERVCPYLDNNLLLRIFGHGPIYIIVKTASQGERQIPICDSGSRLVWVQILGNTDTQHSFLVVKISKKNRSPSYFYLDFGTSELCNSVHTMLQANEGKLVS